MRSALVAATLVAALAGQPGRGHAGGLVSDPDAPLTFEIDRERTTRQKVIVGALAGGAVVLAGVGVLFHLDSKDKSDQVSASGAHTGLTYTDEVDDLRRDALRSRALTIASYGVGGGLLVASLVVYLATDPGTETLTVGTERSARPALTVEPRAGGALVHGAWSF